MEAIRKGCMRSNGGYAIQRHVNFVINNKWVDQCKRDERCNFSLLELCLLRIKPTKIVWVRGQTFKHRRGAIKWCHDRKRGSLFIHWYCHSLYNLFHSFSFVLHPCTSPTTLFDMLLCVVGIGCASFSIKTVLLASSLKPYLLIVAIHTNWFLKHRPTQARFLTAIRRENRRDKIEILRCSSSEKSRGCDLDLNCDQGSDSHEYKSCVIVLW